MDQEELRLQFIEEKISSKIYVKISKKLDQKLVVAEKKMYIEYEEMRRDLRKFQEAALLNKSLAKQIYDLHNRELIKEELALEECASSSDEECGSAEER